MDERLDRNARFISAAIWACCVVTGAGALALVVAVWVV